MARKKKTNPKQMELISYVCPHHGPENVCDACPGRLSTDGRGFVHPRDAGGKTPLRKCRHCGMYRTVQNWSVTDYAACKECATAAARARATEARAMKTGEPRFDGVQESAARGFERKVEEKTDYTGREIK